jgi:hypothetical protein
MNELCDLAAGRLDRWRGLVPFPLAEAPTCIGTPEGPDRYQKFGYRWARYRVFRRPEATAVLVTRLFVFGDSLVRLVEVYGLPVEPAELAARRVLAATRARQGEPEALGDWPPENEFQLPLLQYGEVLREYVFGDVGLALLVGEGTEQPALRLARLRGFEPTTAREYRERYIALAPIEFLPE